MRHSTLIVTALLFGTLIYSATAEACSSIKATAQIETFECASCGGDSDTQESSIFTVSGSLVLSNRRATPELASLVLEFEAKIDGSFVTVARRVLNESGDSVVENCEGLFADDALPGRLVLVDANQNPISFASVKSLPEGRTGLRYIASFGGGMPRLAPGTQVRIRVLTTAINADSSRTCEIDANNDGAVDSSVKTHITKSILRLPTTVLALMP